MEYSVEGTLQNAKPIEKILTKNGEKEKRKFTLKTNEQFPQLLELELFGDKVKLLSAHHTDDFVRIRFDLRGRECVCKDGTKRVFHSLSVISIDKVDLNAENDAVEVPDDDFSQDMAQVAEELPF